jgi:hypothetical protein
MLNLLRLRTGAAVLLLSLPSWHDQGQLYYFISDFCPFSNLYKTVVTKEKNLQCEKENCL